MIFKYVTNRPKNSKNCCPRISGSTLILLRLKNVNILNNGHGILMMHPGNSGQQFQNTRGNTKYSYNI